MAYNVLTTRQKRTPSTLEMSGPGFRRAADSSQGRQSITNATGTATTGFRSHAVPTANYNEPLQHSRNLQPGESSIAVPTDIMAGKQQAADQQYAESRGVVGNVSPGDFNNLRQSFMQTNQAAMAMSPEQKAKNAAGNARLQGGFMSPMERNRRRQLEQDSMRRERTQVPVDIATIQGRTAENVTNSEVGGRTAVSAQEVAGRANVAGIVGQTAQNVAGIQGKTATDVAGIGAEANKYVADSQGMTAENVAGIGADTQKYVVDSQGNTTLNAEFMRGQSGLAQEEIRGQNAVDLAKASAKPQFVTRKTAVQAGDKVGHNEKNFLVSPDGTLIDPTAEADAKNAYFNDYETAASGEGFLNAKGLGKGEISKLDAKWLRTGRPLEEAPHRGGQPQQQAQPQSNEFASVEEANKAGLPPGTKVLIGGRLAVVE